MVKCVLCGKQRAEFEMRPLVNIDELKVGNALAETDKAEGAEAERDVGGSKVQVVCRQCWHAILESKDKAAVIEMMETLCGLLFEIDRRARDAEAKAKRAVPVVFGGDGDQWEVVEKKLRGGRSPGIVPAPRQTTGGWGHRTLGDRIHGDGVYVGDPLPNTSGWTVGPNAIGTTPHLTISATGLRGLADSWSAHIGAGANEMGNP